jgi:hypothetical protein
LWCLIGALKGVSVYCDLGEERLVTNHRDPWVQLGYVVRRCAEQGGLRSRAGCGAGRAVEQGGVHSRASCRAGRDEATTYGAEVGEASGVLWSYMEGKWRSQGVE